MPGSTAASSEPGLTGARTGTRATLGQLAGLFPVSRPAVSQHVRLLVEAGLVRPGETRQSPYELDPQALILLEAWLSKLIDTWRGAPLRADDRHREPATKTQRTSAEPFAKPDYLVAAASGGRGVDTGMTAASDGRPLTIAVITVPSLEQTMRDARAAGGTVVVEPFTISGVGRACYVADPAGVLLGIHEYDPDAQ